MSTGFVVFTGVLEGKMKNYFISYNHHDEQWAAWIDWTLRAAGYDTIVQVYDFPVGSNFVSNMHDALKQADHVLCVLTQDFLNSNWCKEEWTSALERLIPVRVADVHPNGLLEKRVYIDLFGLSEGKAKENLLTAIKGNVRPTEKPPFPTVKESKPVFPDDATTHNDSTIPSDEPKPTLIHPTSPTRYYKVGLMYLEQLDYPNALKWFQKALKKQLQDPSPMPEDTARIENSLASIYNDMAQYDMAIEFYNRAIAASDDDADKNSATYATFCNNLAKVYYSQAEYTKALEKYQKALAIREKVLGKEHPDTAATYNNIGAAYGNLGDYDEALEWYEKALAIRGKVLGKEHPDTAGTYNNIAIVHAKQSNYEQALEWFQKALAIREKVLGREHPDVAGTYNNIAAVFHAQGDYDKALEWYEKALAIFEKVLGKEHPNTAATYNNIGEVYRNQGKYAEALEWYEKVLAIFEKVLGDDHPRTRMVRNYIAITHKRMGDAGGTSHNVIPPPHSFPSTSHTKHDDFVSVTDTFSSE